MDKRIIKGLIDEKLEVIQEQFSIIRGYEAKIPIIELDLLMTSIRDLYELVLNLQLENMGGNRPQPAASQEVQESAPTPVPPVTQAPVNEEPRDSADDNPSRFSSGILSMERVIEEEPAAEEIPEAVIADEEPEAPGAVLPEEEPYREEEQAAEPPQTEAEEPTLESEITETLAENEPPQERTQKLTADLFSEGAGSTLADRLKEGQEKRIADKLQENIIVDLRTTIGINDKFLFINELFEGNMRDYDEAVQKLNTSTTMAQTDLLLLDFKIDHKWDSESPTVKKFVELVRRKF